jgi:pimeloyl-ACP methyl ester carboxylesterase
LYRIDQLPYFTLAWVSVAQSALRLRGAVPEAALTPDDLREVRPPVSIVWGSNDPFGTVDQGRAGAQFFHDAEFNAIGVGHFPWLDAPEPCGEIVRTFLTRSR